MEKRIVVLLEPNIAQPYIVFLHCATVKSFSAVQKQIWIVREAKWICNRYLCCSIVTYFMTAPIPIPNAGIGIGASRVICVPQILLTLVWLHVPFVHQVREVSDHLPVQVSLKSAARLLQATPLIALISICVVICSFLPALWSLGRVLTCQCHNAECTCQHLMTSTSNSIFEPEPKRNVYIVEWRIIYHLEKKMFCMLQCATQMLYTKNVYKHFDDFTKKFM